MGTLTVSHALPEDLPLIHSLLQGCLDLVILPCCQVCRGVNDAGHGQLFCSRCRQRLELPDGGLQGQSPLPWWSLGWYQGGLRQLLLGQRPKPQPATLHGLARGLRSTLPADLLEQAVLVSIPSWKQRGSNPLPTLISKGLAMPVIQPLRRRRPTLGQHHLNRTLRSLNQAGAFGCDPATSPAERRQRRRRPVLLVDDILTTGATAAAAALALGQEGFTVAGLLCLARTPAPGRDLRSMPATAVASRDSSVGRAGD
jgi:predicted amidophosphoribosyltransferase